MPEIHPRVTDHQEFALPYGNLRACFSVDNQDFRRKSTREAVKQGIDAQKADLFLRNVHFSISPTSEYIDANVNIPDLLKPLVKLTNVDHLGLVTKRKDGVYDCHINIETIARLAQKGKYVGNFKSPPTSHNPEANQMVLQQAIDAVSSHEIQHLIQCMQSSKNTAMEKAIATKKLVQKTSLISIVSGVVLISTMSLPVPEHWKIPLITVSGLTVVGSGLGSEVLDRYINYRTSHEVESYSVMKNLETMPSFIKVWFEKP